VNKGSKYALRPFCVINKINVIILFFPEAQCNVTQLGEAITSITTDIASTDTEINTVEVAKQATKNSELFGHYEGE